MQRNVEQNHRTDYARKRTRRHPKRRNSRAENESRSQTAAGLLPLSDREITNLAPKKNHEALGVEYRGEFYPANFVFYSHNGREPQEGERVGEVRPMLPQIAIIDGKKIIADPGQYLYWEQGSVVSRSARRNGNNHR